MKRRTGVTARRILQITALFILPIGAGECTKSTSTGNGMSGAIYGKFGHGGFGPPATPASTTDPDGSDRTDAQIRITMVGTCNPLITAFDTAGNPIAQVKVDRDGEVKLAPKGALFHKEAVKMKFGDGLFGHVGLDMQDECTFINLTGNLEPASLVVQFVDPLEPQKGDQLAVLHGPVQMNFQPQGPLPPKFYDIRDTVIIFTIHFDLFFKEMLRMFSQSGFNGSIPPGAMAEINGSLTWRIESQDKN